MSDAAEAPWLKYQKAAPAEGPWTRYKSAEPERNDTRGKARVSTEGDDNLSVLDHMWRGLMGKDATAPGRFGMGIADPFVGGAQIGARMMAQPGGGVPEQAGAPPGPDLTKQVDAIAQQREHTYEGTRQSANPGEKLETDWHRLIGNVASPVTLAAGGAVGKAMQGVGMAGRLALSAAGGAGIASTEPVTTGKNFGVEKAKQVAGGAVGGAVGGAAGEAVGSGLGRAIAGNDPAAVDKIISTFRRVVKPGRQGRSAAPQITTQDREIITAVDNIAMNAKDIQLTDNLGNALPRGSTPETLRQFSESIDQRKRQIFEKYDSMAKAAETAQSGQPNRHLAEFSGVSRQVAAAQQEVAKAEQAVTMMAARQSRAGNNVYMTSGANDARRQAQTQLDQARVKLERLQKAKAGAKEKAYAVRVDVADAAKQLRATANDRMVADFHPEIVTKANRLARNLETEGTLTLTETQDLIQTMNKELSGFYANHQAAIGDLLAPVASSLRTQLDKAIESTGAPGYQALKNQYGALRSIEKDVSNAFQREAAKVPGGLAGTFGNLVASEELLRGILTADPHALIRGAATKGAQAFLKGLNDPNRAIRRLFQAAANRGGPPSPSALLMSRGVQGALPPIGMVPGGVAGGELGQFPAMPINP